MKKDEAILTGATPGTGEYDTGWNYNQKEMSFENGFPKNSFGVGHTDIINAGKLFMTVNFQFRFIWNGNGDPIVVRVIDNPKCK